MKRSDLPLADVQTFRVPLDQINIPADRARSLKPAQAAAIGAAMLADRQYDPITIVQLPGREGFELVDGLHRLEGARAVCMPDIEARFAPDNSKAARLQQEILSGWARAGEDIFDRGNAINTMATLARESAGLPSTGRLKPGPRSPHDVAKDAEQSFQSIGTTVRWDIATAEALGIKKSTVRNYLVVAECISDEFKARLRACGHAAQLVPLLNFAGLPPEERLPVMEALESGRALTIPDAIALVQGRAKPDVATRRHTAVISNLGRMSGLELKGALSTIIGSYRDKIEALLLSGDFE